MKIFWFRFFSEYFFPNFDIFDNVDIFPELRDFPLTKWISRWLPRLEIAGSSPVASKDFFLSQLRDASVA